MARFSAIRLRRPSARNFLGNRPCAATSPRHQRQHLRDTNGSTALLQAAAPHIGVQRRILELRAEGYVIETLEQHDEYGFALHRLVSESAPAQITMPMIARY
jgi:hypothetical protein